MGKGLGPTQKKILAYFQTRPDTHITLAEILSTDPKNLNHDILTSVLSRLTQRGLIYHTSGMTPQLYYYPSVNEQDTARKPRFYKRPSLRNHPT